MATSLFRQELSDLCLWTETIQAQPHLHLDPDSMNIALQLLLKLDIKHASDLDYYYVGCIYIALKFFDSDNDVNCVFATDFLQLFNPFCHVSSQFMSCQQLYSLEKEILSRVNYHIPTAGDPLLVVLTVGLERYLTLPQKAQLKMLMSLVHYDYMIQHTQHMLSGCRLVSSLRLLTFHLLLAPSLLEDVEHKLELLQHKIQKCTSPFFLTISRLYWKVIHLLLQQDNRHALRLLQKTLTICHQRNLDLSSSNPVLQVLYYPTLSSWLRHSDVSQRREILTQLINFDKLVKMCNPSPSIIVSRCQLLLVFFIIQTRQKRPKLAPLYQAVESVVKQKEWYRLSYKLRPAVYNILHLLMTPLSEMKQSKNRERVFRELRHDLHTLFFVEKLNLLKSGCY